MMSVSSCKIVPSPRSSGGDFHCTEEELFDSFMEIVNNPDHQSFDGALGADMPIQEKDLSENNDNVNSSDSQETHPGAVNIDCYANELHVKESVDELVSEEEPCNNSSTPSCSDVNCDNAFAREVSSEKNLHEDEVGQSSILSQKQSETSQVHAFVDREKDESKHSRCNSCTEADNLQNSRAEDEIDEDKDSLENECDENKSLSGSVKTSSKLDRVSETENNAADGKESVTDENKNDSNQATETKSYHSEGGVNDNVSSLKEQGDRVIDGKEHISSSGAELAQNPGSISEKSNESSTGVDNFTNKNEELPKMDETELNEITNATSEDKEKMEESAKAVCTNAGPSADEKYESNGSASLQNEEMKDKTDDSVLQVIEHDIKEGIRKATQVCDEINEFIMKRMSQSSDEILGENGESNVKSFVDGGEKTHDGPSANHVAAGNTEPQSPENDGIQLDKGAIAVIDGEKNNHDRHVPGIVLNSQDCDSSSTCSSHPDEFHHSDNSNERTKSISESLGSSEGSISGDSKGYSTSPMDTKDGINWEILNIAFENTETDEDDGDVYESSGSYGGFGLMLDNDTSCKLAVDDSRLRTISQSSTISESEFQEEYRRQHSTASLDMIQEGMLCSGYLLKLGGTGMTPKNWRKRWCVLRHDRCLYYYKTAKDKVPCGIVVLSNYIVSRSSEFHKKNCLKISKGGGRTYFFCSETHHDMLRWMEVLRKAADVPDDGTSFMIRKEIIHNVAIPALSIKKPDCHGYLTKQGGKNRNSWKRRYCVLKNGCLYYYREMADTTALGVAKLHGYKLEEMALSGKRNGFRAIPPSAGMRTFTFVADNEYDKKRWIPCLEQSIQSHNTSH